MIKRYYSDTDVSFNIKLNGRRKRVVFGVLTSGGSDYYSADELEQTAIERVTGFGSLFRLVESVAQVNPAEVDEPQLIDIPEISNCADAKAWLREKGVKGALNSRVAICSAALSLGYTFTKL